MKRIIVITCLLLVAFLLISAGDNEKKKGTDVSGVVSYLEGNAQKAQLDAEKWSFMQEKEEVIGGEKVKTLNESRAELALDLGKIIRMAPLTEVDVLKLYKEVDEKGKKKSDIKIKIKEGQIYSKIDALGEMESLEIETPLASATIRGTIFQIDCNQKDVVQLDVIKGEVWVYSNNIEDPREFYLQNQGNPNKMKRPFRRIDKPFKRVSKEEWLEIIKNMQRITISKDGTTTVRDLTEEDIDNSWVEWNKKMDEEVKR